MTVGLRLERGMGCGAGRSATFVPDGVAVSNEISGVSFFTTLRAGVSTFSSRFLFKLDTRLTSPGPSGAVLVALFPDSPLMNSSMVRPTRSFSRISTCFARTSSRIILMASDSCAGDLVSMSTEISKPISTNSIGAILLGDLNALFSVSSRISSTHVW